MGIFERLKQGLFGFYGGPADPRLSPGQNQDAARQAMLQAGLTTIMNADKPGLQSAALGVAAGQQAGAGARQNIMTRENAERMAAIFKSGEADFRQLERAFGQAIASGDFETVRAISPVMSAAIAAGSRQPRALQAKSVLHPITNEPVEAAFDPATGEFYFEHPETGETIVTRTARSAPSTPLVDMGNRQEGALNQAFGQGVGQQLAGLVEGGTKAQSDLATWDQLANLTAQPGVYQGTAGNLVLRSKQLATALGINVEGVPESETIRAIGNQAALQLRNPAGGAGMPGALSDKDRQFLVQMVPGLENTPAGNRMIIEAARRVARRNIEVSQVIQRYAAQNGSMDLGVYKAIEDHFKDSDLFGDLTPPNPYLP
jgi:hypothetical protein